MLCFLGLLAGLLGCGVVYEVGVYRLLFVLVLEFVC